MNLNLDKEKMQIVVKKATNYVVILLGIGFGVLIGANLYRFKEPVEKKSSNPYESIHSSNDVSIATDEADNMLIIDRKTGNYQVFEDSIGLNIFRLYAKNIYKNTVVEGK